jgi:hypothetical protein
MDVSVISALYKARLFHNLTVVRKFTCLQTNILDCSREDIEEGVLLSLTFRLSTFH